MGDRDEACERLMDTLKETIEKLDWQKATDLNTIEAYRNFLGDYPEDKFASLAQDRIRHLEQIEERTMYKPTLEQIGKMAQKGNLIPIYRDLPADMETPVSIYLKLQDEGPCFLLVGFGRGTGGPLLLYWGAPTGGDDGLWQ